MARSAVNDPLEKFRFLVDIALPSSAGTMVRLGFHDIQMPKRTTNKIAYREGHNPDISSYSAGLSTMEDIVMSRGVIGSEGESASDFYRWIKSIHTPTTGISDYSAANSALDTGAGSAMEYRGEVLIKMLGRDGKVLRSWKLYNAFPTHFVPASDLSAAEDGEKSMESLTLAYEDFQELQISSPDASPGDPL